MLGVTIDAMAHTNIWQCYFTDFITLNFVDPGHTPQGDIAQQLLYTYFEPLHSEKMTERMVKLHCHVSIHHISLARMATSLRFLNRIEGVR